MITTKLKIVSAIAATAASAVVANTVPTSATPVTPAADAHVVISNGVLTAMISPLGAELKSVRMGDFEYMWQKTPDHPSGIAPVLFPICGSLYQGRYTFEGREYMLPGHGFAHKSFFRVEGSPDGSSAMFTLESDDATRAMYPFDFFARHCVSATWRNALRRSDGEKQGDCNDARRLWWTSGIQRAARRGRRL